VEVTALNFGYGGAVFRKKFVVVAGRHGDDFAGSEIENLYSDWPAGISQGRTSPEQRIDRFIRLRLCFAPRADALHADRAVGAN
jgi:hypothetical protein